jgi:hypothetical protein
MICEGTRLTFCFEVFSVYKTIIILNSCVPLMPAHFQKAGMHFCAKFLLL